MRALNRTPFAAALLVYLLAFSSAASAAQAIVNSKVPAGQWKAVRLKNLPEGASVGMTVTANGSLVVILVHEAELKQYPAQVNPVFQGTLARKLKFSVAIPDAGHYYIIFDNRLGTREKKVRLQIKATGPKSPASRPQESQPLKDKTEKERI